MGWRTPHTTTCLLVVLLAATAVSRALEFHNKGTTIALVGDGPSGAQWCVDLFNNNRVNNEAIKVYQCVAGNAAHEWVYDPDSGQIKLWDDPYWCDPPASRAGAPERSHPRWPRLT